MTPTSSELTVSVVDDAPAMRKALSRLLRSAGLRVETDAPRRDHRELALAVRCEHGHPLREARARGEQAAEIARGLPLVEPTERGDDRLAHPRAVAAVLHDLQVGARARGLGAEEHRRYPL